LHSQAARRIDADKQREVLSHHAAAGADLRSGQRATGGREASRRLLAKIALDEGHELLHEKNITSKLHQISKQIQRRKSSLRPGGEKTMDTIAKDRSAEPETDGTVNPFTGPGGLRELIGETDKGTAQNVEVTTPAIDAAESADFAVPVDDGGENVKVPETPMRAALDGADPGEAGQIVRTASEDEVINQAVDANIPPITPAEPIVTDVPAADTVVPEAAKPAVDTNAVAADATVGETVVADQSVADPIIKSQEASVEAPAMVDEVVPTAEPETTVESASPVVGAEGTTDDIERTLSEEPAATEGQTDSQLAGEKTANDFNLSHLPNTADSSVEAQPVAEVPVSAGAPVEGPKAKRNRFRSLLDKITGISSKSPEELNSGVIAQTLQPAGKEEVEQQNKAA